MQKELFIEGNSIQDGVYVKLPQDYKIGTKIYPVLHWKPICHHEGKVAFELDWTMAAKGVAFPNDETMKCLVGTNQQANQHQLAPMGKLPGASQEGTLLGLFATRNRDNVDDTYGGMVDIMGLTLSYETEC